MEKRKKPSFLRTDWNRKPRFGSLKKLKWRRARGRHSKIRQKRGGHRVSPEIGYGAPSEIKGLVKGFRPVLVRNLGDLESLAGIKNSAGVLSSKLGFKKKMEIAEKAAKMKIQFLNTSFEKLLAESKKKIEKIESRAASKKAEKSSGKEEKSEKEKGDAK